MRPDNLELEEEIRSHLELSIRERIERGEDPRSARQAALEEFGSIAAARDSMHRVWYSRWFDATLLLFQELRIGLRSLLRTRGLAITVAVTLALGIGANAAIFSVVRSVLLRPLVNRDADRLLYIRQTARGIGTEDLTFSMPEIGDLESRVKSISAFGDFSTVDFTLVGFGGEPRVVTAGVVNGSFFDVMGLRPALGRLINSGDDGPNAAPVAVLTHRFWTTVLHSDPAVVGKVIRLGPGNATVIGVLEPSVPYPAETQIIANVVTSPHHLGATMQKERWHRMTELFGRLAPGATLEGARAELKAVHASMVHAHPESYSAGARVGIEVKTLRDQIASPARTILLLLLAAAAVVFVIACSNVANLILGRSVRRESELAVRAALGASRGALRRTLLAESLALCVAGAALGLLLARPLVAVAARYAARFSVRALEARVDGSVLCLGAVLAVVAAVLLAYVPRLPSFERSSALGPAVAGVRITPGTNRRLKVFATTQIACSFLLLVGAGMLVATLNAMSTANTAYDMRKVLAVDVPPPAQGAGGEGTDTFFQEAMRRIGALPGVEGVASGMVVPWRDSMSSVLKLQFGLEGYQPANGEDNPTCMFRPVSPRFFAVLGVPIAAGRDFTDQDRPDTESVAIVSQSVAQRFFPKGEAVNRHLWLDRRTGLEPTPRRIVGVVADVDDENVVQVPTMTVYLPWRQLGEPSRLFVRATSDPYALVPAVTRTIHDLSADQAVERPATLGDVRTQVLTPQRLNAFVFSAFGGIALLIAVVGVAGVLAFSVGARTREFGIRLAVGCEPRQLKARVLREGAVIAAAGILAGGLGGLALAWVASRLFGVAQMPGVLPIAVAAALLAAAAILASLLPAVRASRVDVIQALRSE
ncbi:MAG TPA: ADOP family duplicated permease [Thermoanaerobaculia bacterium]|jgi:predicted permease|nr:ADOP family duplicated permease [Thermoanaerobaculia bacterium]